MKNSARASRARRVSPPSSRRANQSNRPRARRHPRPRARPSAHLMKRSHVLRPRVGFKILQHHLLDRQSRFPRSSLRVLVVLAMSFPFVRLRRRRVLARARVARGRVIVAFARAVFRRHRARASSSSSSSSSSSRCVIRRPTNDRSVPLCRWRTCRAEYGVSYFFF